jgi:hypothetical protein
MIPVGSGWKDVDAADASARGMRHDRGPAARAEHERCAVDHGGGRVDAVVPEEATGEARAHEGR